MHCQQVGRCNMYSTLVHKTSKCWFIISRSRVPISAGTRGFRTTLTTAGILLESRPSPLPSMSLPIHYLLIITALNDIESELVSRKKSTQTSKQTNKQQTLYSMQSNSRTMHSMQSTSFTIHSIQSNSGTIHNI